jgi:hypothetical protein
MSNSIEIKGQGAGLTVMISGYERPDAENVHDANWLRCAASVAVREFSCKLEAAFTTYDFAEFEAQLDNVLSALKGKASFVTDEKALGLDVEFRNTGLAVVSGVVQVRGLPKAALSFSFETDQTFLRQTHRELRAAVQSFPVRGRTSAGASSSHTGS